MKKAISFVLTICMLVGMLSMLGGCQKYKAEITVYNWGEYIDDETWHDFEKASNIKVNYKTYETAEALYSTMQTGGYDIDVVITSDYMLSRMAEEGMLAKLNYSNIPNFSQIGSAYKGLSFDPNDEYTVPYMWGTVGVIYNSKLITDPVTSWRALFDEKYSGQIAMIDNSRDALAIALLILGYSVNTSNPDELEEAYELLETQKPVLQGYYMDQIFNKLESGEAAIGVYYAGDYLTMLDNNPDLVFVRPEEGSTKFVDSFCVPATSKKKDYAEEFINFMTSAEISERNMGFTGYASPNTVSCENYAANLDARSQEVMFPSDDLLNSYELFCNLPQDILKLYDSLWVKLKS